MKRRLFTFLSALSLILFLACVALWVASYWKGMGINHADTNKRTFQDLAVSRGQFRATSLYQRGCGMPLRIFFGLRNFANRPIDLGNNPWRPGVTEARFPAGVVYRAYGDLMLSGWSLLIPVWAPTLLASALPLVWIIRRKPWRFRRSPGLCPRCGYDLRASPARCPECGSPVS